MLSCYLQGGIGNQLFQISTTLSLAKDIGVECSFPFDQHFLPLQGTKADKYINNVFSKLKRLPHSYYNKLKIINETNFSYKKLPIEDNIFLRGYFQSEKYFKHNEEYIKEIFSFDNNNKKILNKYSHLFKGETCSIHIRRGDYLKFPNEHPILPIEYYNKSMNMFGKNTNFIVFSDDMDWVKKNIKGENIIYIQQNVDYIDLYLMSLCNHNIIANSTFSWWGAWLNNNQNKKVIAPSIWFGINKKLDTKDLIPEKWIKI